MRVLVGGGTGFVGRALTQLLRSRGHEVTAISRHPGKNQITWNELSHSGLPPCEGAVNLAGENVLNPFRRHESRWLPDTTWEVHPRAGLPNWGANSRNPAPPSHVLQQPTTCLATFPLAALGRHRKREASEPPCWLPDVQTCLRRALDRWSEPFRQEVVASRVETTKILAKAIVEAEHPPRAWVLVTGVGYYRPSRSTEYTEESPGGDFDFFSRLVTRWEAAAKIPHDATRQVVVRSGVVLGRDGGAIAQMLWPFRLGLGGPIGSGRQPFPWIHVADLAGIVAHALEREDVGGILNGVAPSAVATTNGGFAQALGSALRRPAMLPLPGFVVSAIFGPERSVMLLEGQRVVPQRTLESNFCFAFPDLPSALQDVLA